MTKPRITRKDEGNGSLPVGDLQSIPGVGRSLAWDLIDLGFHQVQDLRGADPDGMYRQLGLLRSVTQDRCVLYVFRCAVYFAGTARPDPELLKWWNWSDAKGGEARWAGVSRRLQSGSPIKPAF